MDITMNEYLEVLPVFFLFLVFFLPFFVIGLYKDKQDLKSVLKDGSTKEADKKNISDKNDNNKKNDRDMPP